MAPSVSIIGIDRTNAPIPPSSWTTAEIIAQLRVDAGRRQVDQLLAWAPPDPGRVWAVENAHGMGHLLAQQLIGRGETVVATGGVVPAGATGAIAMAPFGVNAVGIVPAPMRTRCQLVRFDVIDSRVPSGENSKA